MFNLELSLEELQELHVTLVLRKGILKDQVAHENEYIAKIAVRQLERISPLLYYVESTLREYHDRENVLAKDINAAVEQVVEQIVERDMDKLDKKLMQGHITQEDYDLRVAELDDWAKGKLHKATV